MKFFEKLESKDRIYGRVIEFFNNASEQRAIINNDVNSDIYKNYKLRR
jgi:hypothetical protein